MDVASFLGSTLHCDNRLKHANHPQIVIIVVGKRHHTRFYPTDNKSMDSRTGNPMPGTVVDRGVTSHYLWDFFLQAHKGLQGTARPAHYVVIKDELNSSQDALESFVQAHVHKPPAFQYHCSDKTFFVLEIRCPDVPPCSSSE